MAFPVIDAHQHVWDKTRAEYTWLDESSGPINRAIGFPELEPELADAGVDLTVLVQSADNAEDTALMVETADAHPKVAAIVGWVPLERPEEAAQMLQTWHADPRMVGVRNLIHDMDDPNWLLRPEVDEGLGVLESTGTPFDLVSVLPRHLELAPIISERHPDLRIVIDHLSKPPIGLDSDQPWDSLIAAAAQNPNVFAKLSGLYSATSDPSAWTSDLVAPYVDRALELFGPERLMYGGDWPISILAGGYTRVWQGLSAIFAALGEHDREQILGRTAAHFYTIKIGHDGGQNPD
ncbi:MAG: amidohydrolase family protein [Beutenbergiaceae bacterium]